MTEFESFRQAVLENNDLQEEVFSIVDTAEFNEICGYLRGKIDSQH